MKIAHTSSTLALFKQGWGVTVGFEFFSSFTAIQTLRPAYSHL